MPSLVGPNGCTIATIDEIIAQILNGTTDFPGLYSIYGSDINVDPNAPDGQFINIFAQLALDQLEFILQVYNSFDPDKAIGVSLDARASINGVIRKPGTRTIQPMSIVVTQAMTLKGVDNYPSEPFTVQDAAGNQYQLQVTQNPVGAGTVVANFQSLLLGPISSALNTITQAVTILQGVTSVNNPTLYTTLGITEETDYQLRLRRAASVSLPSRGFIDGLYAALIDTDNVSFARVYENVTNATDGNGIPAHSIWVIVAGGTDTDVANAIYVERSMGCGMKGTVVIPVLQVDGTYFSIQFDRPTAENLWIKFDVAAITGSVDPTYIRQQLLLQLSYGINMPADTTTIVSLIRAIAPNASVSNEGVSNDNVTYVSLLNNSAVNKQWALSSPRIIINGSPGP